MCVECGNVFVCSGVSSIDDNVVIYCWRSYNAVEEQQSNGERMSSPGLAVSCNREKHCEYLIQKVLPVVQTK